MLELWSAAAAYERIEEYLRERGFFTPGGERLEADLYLGYALSSDLRRRASAPPFEPCHLPLAAVAVRDVSQGQSHGQVRIGHWEPTWTPDAYAAAVEGVREAIER